MQRFRLIEDDASHWYLIPAEKVTDFTDWVEYHGDYNEGIWDGEDFDKYRINGGVTSVTFIDPQFN